MRNWLLIGLLAAAPALAAPRIEAVVVKPGRATFSDGKPPQVEVAVTVNRPKIGTVNCEARVDLGDGSRAKTLDFGVASTRNLRHVYEKAGAYKITAKGSGKAPCEGSAEAALTVVGAPAPAKKVEAKKKPEPKKKPEAKKKPQTKKKAEAKKKAAPKKKGAEAPPSRNP